MSALTPDERAIAAAAIRELGNSEMLRALADKLEPEPEPHPWMTDGFPAAAKLAGYGDEKSLEDFARPELVINMIDVMLREAAQALQAMLDASRTGEGVARAEALAQRSVDDIRDPDAGLPRTARERDEAREALRDLLALCDREATTPGDVALLRQDLSLAIDVARSIVEGVERTHALVPNTALEQIRRLLFFYPPAADPRDMERVRLAPEYARAIEAATRGERVEWPA